MRKLSHANGQTQKKLRETLGLNHLHMLSAREVLWKRCEATQQKLDNSQCEMRKIGRKGELRPRAYIMHCVASPTQEIS